MKIKDVFYKMKGLTINSVNVTSGNIDTFGLYKRFESNIADIYATFPKSKKGQFIIHVKISKEYSKSNEYLNRQNLSYPYVDWFEDGFDELVNYIKERL